MLQFHLLRTLRNKSVHFVQFQHATRFETARVMETETGVGFEYHLVIDIVFSTLLSISCCCSKESRESPQQMQQGLSGRSDKQSRHKPLYIFLDYTCILPFRHVCCKSQAPLWCHTPSEVSSSSQRWLS